ncbi:MAG: thioesterase family protein [Pseudonocardiaceae bacterium]
MLDYRAATRIDRHVVTAADLTSAVYPHLDQPEVVTTSRLLEWCEQAAMDAMGVPTLGISVALTHIAPTVLHSAVTVDATCVNVDGRRTSWNVCARDEHETLLCARIGFAQVDTAEYHQRRVVPKQRLLLPA